MMKAKEVMMSRMIGMAVALMAASGSVSANAQDAAAGGVTFKQRCMMCHTITAGQQGTTGPNLRGVGGRQAGSTTFPYSNALKRANVRWTAPNLETFLTAPNKMVPGTRMVVAISDEKKRAEVVAYLMSLK